jgi:hypothetical protein
MTLLRRTSLVYLCVVPLLAAGALAGPARAEYPIIAGWDQQFFPSYIIAHATVKHAADEEPSDGLLGDPNGLIGVVVTPTQSGQRVKVTVSCDEFLETSQFSGRLGEADLEVTIQPKIRYRYDRLSRCRQATPATLTVRVELDSRPAIESSLAVTFRSINDCPLLVATGDGLVDTQSTFAAYVNEQHPFVDKLLREALDRGIVNRFTGYQGKDPGKVIRQVYALWDLMVARDVRYSSITQTAADSHEIASQHVRLIEETANNSQANCVDGSVLFVSLLRKIGIQAALVLEPGHCYVLFAADEEGKLAFGLETTLIDEECEEDDDLPELFEDAVDEELRDEYSWASFIAAVSVATQQLAKNQSKFKNADEHDYRVIDIASARKDGVLPIPFDGKAKFVAYDHSAAADDLAMDYDEDYEDDEDEDEDEDDE